MSNLRRRLLLTLANQTVKESDPSVHRGSLWSTDTMHDFSTLINDGHISETMVNYYPYMVVQYYGSTDYQFFASSKEIFVTAMSWGTTVVFDPTVTVTARTNELIDPSSYYPSTDLNIVKVSDGYWKYNTALYGLSYCINDIYYWLE